jgi:hypothetical protein
MGNELTTAAPAAAAVPARNVRRLEGAGVEGEVDGVEEDSGAVIADSEG